MAANKGKQKPVARAARPAPRKAAAAVPTPAAGAIAPRVREALALLERKRSARDRENLARFGIHAKHALGVSMANVQQIAKRLGRDHELAAALWATGVYEARMLCAFVDDPGQVTAAQMDRWCRDFDNWGICDTLCFKLFDQTPYAWVKVAAWRQKRDEFGKRAAFALLASLAGHDKLAADARFLEGLRWIEEAAGDERNFVKKAVNWALRATGRRNAALHGAALQVSRRLSESSNAAARWVGKDALRELTGPVVTRQMAAKARKAKGD